MVMDPSFTEFSNSLNGLEFDDDTISPTFDHSETLANTLKFKDDPVGLNGFECDDDTISPTFDQFETLANTFKFKDDPVDLNFMECPYVHPDSNPGLVSLTSNGSSELDSPDDGDLSDDKNPDSPNQPPPYFNQNIESPDSLFGSSSEQSTNSNTNSSVDSQWIVDPEEYKPSVQSYPSGYVFTSQTTSQWSFGSLKSISDNVNGPMDIFASSHIVSNMFSGSESILQFNKGVEKASKMERESSGDNDLCYAVLRYINQVLMEDDSEDKADLIQDSTLHAAERNPSTKYLIRNILPRPMNTCSTRIQGATRMIALLVVAAVLVTAISMSTSRLNLALRWTGRWRLL
ncbi:hypothetical protein Acr_26g0013090 [Actinidia rufa]|uniref:Uncharacterized protein n=1 Tax=Actinidia rufa TaxID=165716 RepID=A0A7J0H4L1_9ERIC|nr:hypothetical protein Acr_26g0013090 [Actinidia rufa]